jgi:hypothetical protein
MTTYQEQLKADIEREEVVFADTLAAQDVDMAYAGKAGGMAALATFYAISADHEAAERQRLGRDPKALIAAFTGQIAGPSAEDIATLLGELYEYLRLRPELEDARFALEEATHACEYQAGCERERAEEAAEAEIASNEAKRANLFERGITTC